MSSAPALFQPIRVGELNLKHRVVLTPSTRFRATADGTPNPIMADYYAQRATVPGTLLIAEATFIARKAGGFRHAPGVWSSEQIAAWKQITDAVHAKGSYIYLQLWALGRNAYVEHLAPRNPYVSSSPKKIETPFHRDATPRTNDVPRAMTVDEIKEYAGLYATAAANAVDQAGFDGVELHGANRYLPEQFLLASLNERDDEYGGSIGNRARFTLEVLDAIVAAVGAKKTAIRLSPWANKTQHGKLSPTYSYLVKEIRERHPDFSYIHLIEDYGTSDEAESNDFLREIWGSRPLISAGGYSSDRDSAFRIAEERGDMIAFSRAFIANPDLPCRLAHKIPLVKGDGAKYFRYGSSDPSGYTDYAFHDFTAVNAGA
ncbi:FMN-linked oxidoreductase [Mycena venus]|uniref:FMN-linked oxidoreductase n=1 Tax=Mycena venus TaxID=2733690 RepID=A0A8H6X9J6_9AGAR|nr:FMN-linked oxidoreductase [Mycena venus]